MRDEDERNPFNDPKLYPYMIFIVSQRKQIVTSVLGILKKEFPEQPTLVIKETDDIYSKLVAEASGILILDWDSPGVKGKRICQEIHNKIANSIIPILALYDPDSTARKKSAMLSSSVDLMLELPVRKQDFVAQIRTLLRMEKLDTRQFTNPEATVVVTWEFKNDYPIPILVSPNVAEISGVSSSQFMNRDVDFVKMIHPDDKDRVVENLMAYRDSDRVQNVQRFRIRNAFGQEQWVRDLTIRMGNENNTFVSYLTDITETVDLSRDLTRKEMLIRNVLKQSREGILVTDESGLLIEWSQGMETILGVQAKDVLGKPVWDIQTKFIPEDRKSKKSHDYYKKQIAQMLKTGDRTTVKGPLDIRVINLSGEERFLSQTMSLFKTAMGFGLVGFFRDQTDEIKTSRNLEETRKRYATLFQASPDGFILEDKNGNIMDCNPASSRILGYRKDQLIGMNVRELVPDEVQSEVEKNINNVLTEGILSHNVKNIRPDGSHVVLELHEVKVPLPSGEDGILVIHRDITERMKAERELSQRDKILSVITEAAESLLHAESWSDPIDNILQNLGEAISATRVALTEDAGSKSEERRSFIRSLWHIRGFGFKSRSKILDHKKRHIAQWDDRLEQGKIVAVRKSQAIDFEKLYFDENRTKSVLIIPIFLGTSYWGCLWFDDGKIERKWTDVEVEALRISANLLAGYIQRSITDTALNRVAESISITAEDNFFESMVSELCNVLECDAGFVGIISREDHEKIETTVFVKDGKIADQLVYDLEGTPCKQVLNHELEHYTTDIIEKFPNDEFLRDEHIHSYCGVPLFDSKQNPLGVIVVMSRSTIKNSWLVESLLKVFAVRAGAELERRIAYETIRFSEEKFRMAFKTSPDAVNINRLSDGMYVEINEGFTAITGFTWEDVDGKTSHEINIWYNPEDRKRLVDGLMKNGVYNNLEAKFRFKDGRIHTGLMSARVINMKGEPHILSITRDIDERKQNEIWLRESEARYRKLVDQAPVGIGIHAEGVWRFINMEAVKMLGYQSWDDLLGKPVLDVMHPDSKDDAKARIIEMAKTGKPVPIVEEKLIRKDGSTLYALVSSTPIQYKGENAFQVSAVDITPLKQAESEIQILSEAVQQSISSIVITDLNGNIEYVNPKFTEVTGWSGSEAIGQNTNILKSGNTTDQEYKELWSTILSGKVWDGEFYNKKKDGTLYWEHTIIAPVVDSNSEIQHFLAVKEDITEKKATLAKLEESEAKFRSLFEESLDTIYLSTPDGRILDINPAGESLLGYSRDELLGLNAGQLYADRQDRENFIQLMKDNGFVRDYKVDLRKKDESTITCLITSKAVKAGEDATPVYSGLIHDISDRERDRQRLEEALLRAQEGERVKTLFLANMSHEIRTPLNSVLGFVELLRKDQDLSSDEERDEVIDIIQASGERLMRTVHEILDISQIEAGTFSLKPEDLNLNDLISQVIKEHSQTIKMRDLDLLNLSEIQRPMVHGDKESLLKAISNLVDNAIKYTPSGTIKLHLKTEESNYALYIKDSGIGISSDYMEHMYDVFSQESTGFTKKFQGLGLGLSITKRCLDMNGVQISVESEKDVGTTFRLEFQPLVEEEVPGSENALEIESPESDGFLGSVIVVEDDPSTQLLMEYFLKSRYHLYYAVSVKEAKDLLKKVEPKTVLLDVTLAGQEDGLQLVKDMRNSDQWKHIPVIALTAHAFVTDRERCLKAGCDDYFAKPVKQAVLLDRIRELNS